MPVGGHVNAPHECRLIIVSGDEGAGKSTIIRALLPQTPRSASIDAEDLGQVNPCPMDDLFFDLLRHNVAVLAENFWGAGYVNVIAGSFIRDYADYVAFQRLLTQHPTVVVVELLVAKAERDVRRTTRLKPTTQEWRDRVDVVPEDLTIRQSADADYRYVGLDTTHLDVVGTIQRIRAAIPEIYAA
jgi:chloramphenicol 3-O-phosphotransferase